MFAHGKEYRLFLWEIVLILLVVASSGMLTAHETEKIDNIQIWDTILPFLNQVDIQDKTGWEVVPTGTGRVYSSKGDIVVENEFLTAVFCSKKGEVIIYSKYGESLQLLHRGYLKTRGSGKKRMELIPLQLKGKTVNITSCKIFSNIDDEVTLEVYFSAKEMGKNLSAIFSFSKKQIIEVKPAENMKGISLLCPIEFAIVPSFISDDLIFDPRDYSSIETLYVPSENLFLGLLRGEDGMLVITWPKGNQEMKLVSVNKKEGDRLFESIDFKNDGKSIYLAILDAQGIWHKEELKPSYLEKDIAIDWKRPFLAKWITQLNEDGVRTTFPFKRPDTPYFRGESFFRSGIGTYTYPLWFRSEHLGERAFYHLGKKIPPEGESIIYFLEGSKNTPVPVSSTVDIIKQTLDNQICESMLDSEGRLNRSLRRPNVVCNTATCHVTARLKPIFEVGKEVERKKYIKDGIEDLMYFLTKERERAFEYQDFAHEMIEFLILMKKDRPESKPFLDKIENITREIIAAYDNEKENIKDLEYAEKLAIETEALTQRKNSDNLAAFIKLQKKWTGMGGAVDDLNRKHHTIARKLFQEAGYSCVRQQETVKIAEEIRRRTIKCLRRPNRYEIWSNY